MDGKADGVQDRTDDVSGVRTATVIAESNGHHWIKWHTFVSCRDCGFIRRADDKNRPCPGTVKVDLRANAQRCVCCDPGERCRGFCELPQAALENLVWCSDNAEPTSSIEGLRQWQGAWKLARSLSGSET
jgi:hypothetical protein